MQFVRIGDKLISRPKIQRKINQALNLRSRGYSQKEVANKLNLERSFISRLESIGQIRKGNRIALLGFPIANKEAVLQMAAAEGIDYSLILNDEERWDFLESKDGVTLFNEILKMISELQEYEVIIFMGSDMRVELVQSLIDGEVIGMSLGPSPLKNNVTVDLDELRSIIGNIRKRRNNIEKGG